MRPPLPALAFALLLAAPALAQEPRSGGRLEDTQRALEESQEREQEIIARSAQVEEELRTLQGSLVRLSDVIRRNERGLLDAEDKLHILTRELQDKQATLAGRRRELSALIQAAIRLSQMPPEAALMMPGDFNDTLKTSRILTSLTESIRRESEDLRAQMEELQSLQNRVRQSQERISADQESLKSQQKELDAMVGDRRRLAGHLLQEQAGARKRVAQLSRQARDLKDLLGKLEQDRAAEAEQQEATPRRKRPSAASPRLRSFTRAKGGLIIPVAGRVVRGFGEQLARNETSKGITLEAREGAKVLAPYDGEVVFTGPFLTYGNMVILRHSDDFHTLLAGFAEIAVAVGQFLLEGEPIGAMGKPPSGTGLYLELRHSNQPIDPAPWIPGLTKTN